MGKVQQIYDNLTSKVIAAIESGDDFPWSKPWKNVANAFIYPTNLLTGVPYSGSNVISLMIAQFEHGYTNNAWLTYNQARKLGGYVRKGEKGIGLVKCLVRIVSNDQDGCDVDDEDSGKKRISAIPFTVFNIDQIDGIDLQSDDCAEPPVFVDEPAVALDNLVAEYCEHTTLQFQRIGNSAYYAPHQDLIVIPEGFDCGHQYARVLSHELTHSTGHKSRLNRFDNPPIRFEHRRAEYAFEELVADLGSVFLGRHVGIVGAFESNAAYLKSWLQKLKEDSKFLVKAASYASKSTQYLLQYAPDYQAIHPESEAVA